MQAKECHLLISSLLNYTSRSRENKKKLVCIYFIKNRIRILCSQTTTVHLYIVFISYFIVVQQKYRISKKKLQHNIETATQHHFYENNTSSA